MNTWLKRLGVWSLVAVAAFANADIRDMHSSVNGSGKLRIGRNDYTLNRAAILTKTDGSFEMTLRSSNDSWTFKGDYNRVTGSAATFSIKSGSGGRSNGLGSFSITGDGELNKLAFRGNGSEGDILFSFDRDARSNGLGNGRNVDPTNRMGRNGFGDTARGEGTYRNSSQLEQLREVDVLLMRDGVAQLRFKNTNGDYHSLSGNWFERRGDKIDLSIDQADRMGRIDARGQITLNAKGELYRVDLDGTMKGQNFEVRFQRNDQWKPGAGGNNSSNWKSFSDSSRGDGTVSKQGKSYEINNGAVRLYDNGTFEITLKGSKDYKYSGSWRRNGDGAQLFVSGGGTGGGSVSIRNGKLYRIEIDVIDGGDRLRFRFQAN